MTISVHIPHLSLSIVVSSCRVNEASTSKRKRKKKKEKEIKEKKQQ